MLIIHPSARISKLADIEDSVRGSKIEIDRDVVVDSFVKIKPAGGMGDLIIGAGSQINSGCVLYTGHGIRIGNNVLVGANCTFVAANHAYRERHRLIREQRFMPSRGGIVVEDDVWIGANCVLLDGAKIGCGAVIAAGSLVRGPVEAYTVAAGSPLRVIGRRADGGY